MKIPPKKFDEIFYKIIKKRSILNEFTLNQVLEIADGRRVIESNITAVDICKEMNLLSADVFTEIERATTPIKMKCSNSACSEVYTLYGFNREKKYWCIKCKWVLQSVEIPEFFLKETVSDFPKDKGDSLSESEIFLAYRMIDEDHDFKKPEDLESAIEIDASEIEIGEDDEIPEFDSEQALKLIAETAGQKNEEKQKVDFSEPDFDDEILELDDISGIIDDIPELKVTKLNFRELQTEEQIPDIVGLFNGKGFSDIPADKGKSSKKLYHSIYNYKPITGFERYSGFNEIDRGGMGKILKVSDEDIHRSVAMKVILPNVQNNPRSFSRFIDEARITGQLEHPNIVPVHELGFTDDDSFFFTMKYVKGVSLLEILAELSEINSKLETSKSSGSFRAIPSSTWEKLETEDLSRLTYEHKNKKLILRKFAKNAQDLNWILEVFLKVCDAVAFAH